MELMAVADQMRTGPVNLTRLLPPFAAMHHDQHGTTMVADSMGFRQLFHTAPGAGGNAALSSSALAAGRARGTGLDKVAVGNQSLLGWQLGRRTLFEDVEKLVPGAVARLDSGPVAVEDGARHSHDPLGVEHAVAEAATLLRTSLAALLDDHPDAVLQLTGGLDSRLLLSAIPPSRRRGLRAMTLGVPGSGDVSIAAKISARYGLEHDVRDLASVDGVSPADAWRLCVEASIRLDAMSDPVALAALGIGERSFAQGVRISGLGGEVARGFYYVGRVVDRSYTRKDASRLASWRMFVNESVEPGLLTDEFSAWARDAAEGEVFEALQAGGDEWFRATDELYLRHRMQRWAGATDTAVSAQRIVINPMLDRGFLEIAARLSPQDKAGSRFLASLQMALDPELGAMPLDGRPAPAAYADPSPWQPVAQTLSTGKRFVRKSLQRVRRGNRPPAGGDILAAKVVTHWRANPDLLSTLASLDFIEREWMGAMLAGDVEPRPSSVAFLTNLAVATSDM
ncbi:asparagine synthase-related protein [Microbacterium invictum]|uniref:Asparagine synthase (Glutamine-hydrolyzing) n=1 Tax=Microbacterium invictum TaxID=515415 RepID=A0AA40VMN9_9MICO|nr:asparagine synthase (glutamine-hydrolyzing) [Microbacterium invictum]